MIDKNNDEIISEAFNIFKKKGYSEKLRDSQAQYTPVKNTDDTRNFISGDPKNGFVVSNPETVVGNLVKGLGMAVGSNTVKSLANKAIKNFPIIVSDDISPETLVIIKTMMEEQYASYIDLLVSNQLIHITDYDTNSDEGNIAIQALNRLDGTEFGKGRIARKAAQTGNITMDDLMKNYPGWQFIREDSNKLVSGNPILDTLLENAIIVPSEYTQPVAEKVYDTLVETLGVPSSRPFSAYISTAAADLTDEIIISKIRDLRNDPNWVPESTGKEAFLDGEIFVDMESGLSYKRDIGKWVLINDSEREEATRRLGDIEKARNTRLLNVYKQTGVTPTLDSNGTRFIDSLRVPSALKMNDEKLDDLLDLSVAEILDPASYTTKDQKTISNFIKDRYTKASYLLVNKRISGVEYISYIRDRLGLPISFNVSRQIKEKYPLTEIEFRGIPSYDVDSESALIKKIESHNYKYFENKIVPDMMKITAKDIAIISGISLGGVGGGALIGAAAAAAFAVPILMPVMVAGALGGVAAGVIAAIKNYKKRKTTKIESKEVEMYDGGIGWERVEFLINQMDLNAKEAYESYLKTKINIDSEKEELQKIEMFKKADEKVFNSFAKELDSIISNCAKENRIAITKGNRNHALTEGLDLTKIYDSYKKNESIEAARNEFLDDLNEAILELDDSEILNMIDLEESNKITLNFKKPGDIIVKQRKVDTKALASVVPEFGTRDIVAYGSVEYDRRDIKDRKFNEPLILTIKFRERYSDGKYNDNELTAVIGILGVVTRVPSDEMAYILKSNAEGVTLKNLFNFEDSKNIKDSITNLIGTFSKSKYAEKLPVSGSVWANLEKVTALAVANTLTGNNNGNISNAHLVFSQREIDAVKNELGIDYLKNAKLAARLMKRYSAFMLAVCNDVMQYLYTYSDPDAISWDDAPYSAYMGKSNSDQLLSAFTQYNRQRL